MRESTINTGMKSEAASAAEALRRGVKLSPVRLTLILEAS
jgi:hypothetical protein